MVSKVNSKPVSVLTIIFVAFFVIVALTMFFAVRWLDINPLKSVTKQKIVSPQKVRASAPPDNFPVVSITKKQLRSVNSNLVYVNMTVHNTLGEGNVIFEINKEWAPLGAARFEELVKANYFDDARFFRVIKVTSTSRNFFILIVNHF
jgi:hypothetical protein